LKLQTIKKAAVSAVMTMALSTATFVAVPQAYADDHARCQRQIEKAESKLDQAIRRHGGTQPAGGSTAAGLECRARTLLQQVSRMVGWP
jgi:hypothetical protein